MLMVVLSHYFEWGEASITNNGLAHFMASLGDPGVGIFFFLSGYALYKGYGNGFLNAKAAGKYFLGRIMGVYLPYIVIVGIINLMYGGFEDHGAILNFLIGKDYWFMAIIFALYIAYGFTLSLPKYRMIIISLFVLDLSLWLYLSGYSVFWYDAIWCFPVGLFVAKYDSNWNFVRKGFSIDIKDYVLCFIGRISLYIYMLHSFIYNRLALGLAEKEIELNWYLSTIASFVITCVCGYLLNIIFNLWKRGRKGEKVS